MWKTPGFEARPRPRAGCFLGLKPPFGGKNSTVGDSMVETLPGCGTRDRSDMGGSLEMEAKLKTNLDTNLIKLAAIISLDPFL